MCLGTHVRGSRQFNMFMSENICTMVDLQQGSFRGGEIITVERKSEDDNETDR